MKEVYLPYYNKTACIIAPAYGVAEESQIASVLQNISVNIDQFGFKAKYYPNMLAPYNISIFTPDDLRIANSDEVRFDQLKQALHDPDCNFIWALKGGYGSIRIVNTLSEIEKPEQQKLFIGFSDITVIHAFVNNVWNWPSIHYGNLVEKGNIALLEDNKQSFLYLVEQKQTSFSVVSISDNIITPVSGKIIGGNFITFLEVKPILNIDFTKTIIVLEDVMESPHKIDGYLQSLKITPTFEFASAVIFASFIPSDNTNTTISAYPKIMKDFASTMPFPVFQMLPDDTIGHTDVNKALLMGAEGSITPHNSSCVDGDQYEFTAEL